jgi:hypothetical protein
LVYRVGDAEYCFQGREQRIEYAAHAGLVLKIGVG